MGRFFLNRDTPVIEKFPYNLAPTAWLANCYNGLRNSYLQFRAKRDFKKECSELLDAEDLVKRLKATHLEPGRFTRVSSLGNGASAKVELVKDTNKKDKLFALKIFMLKDIITSPEFCSSYVRIKIYHKERGTTKYQRWLRKRDNVSECKASPSESATSFVSDVLYNQLAAMKNEIDILTLLRSKPYIITYYDTYVGLQSKNVLICTQFCDTSLGWFVTKSRLFSAQELQAIATSVLLGLREIHRMGYIHLDIKPENILVSKDGKIKICDFGSAVKIGHLPQTSTAGTGAYYSPELHYAYYAGEGLLSNTFRVDGIHEKKDFFEAKKKVLKCDVWAFGITMLILCVGEEVVNALMQGDEKDFLLGLILHMLKDNPSKSLLSSAYLQEHDDQTETTRALRAGARVSEGMRRLYIEGGIGEKLPGFFANSLVFRRVDRYSIDELLRCDFVDQNINASVTGEKIPRSQSHTKAWSVIGDLIHREFTKSDV